MSQRCIGYEGDGKARRPLWRDEGPASASMARQVGEGKTALLDGLPDRSFVGAGAIERRQITEAERVVKARPALNSPEYMSQARQRGGAVTGERAAARRLEAVPEPEEEPAVDDEPEPLRAPEALDAPSNPYAVLADAAIAAAEAWDALLVARAAYDDARRAVNACLPEVGSGTLMRGPVPERLDAAVDRALADPGPAYSDDDRRRVIDEAVASVALDGKTQVVEEPTRERANIPEIIPEPPAAIGGGSARRVRGNAVPDGLTAVQERVLKAVVAANGARRPVSLQLGMSVESVEQSLALIGKKGLLPVDLIQLLPARFAKYARVARD